MNEQKIKTWNDKFNLCLEIEFSNPEYFKVHHILVVTFMLQTGKYSSSHRDEAILLLREFLSHPLKAPTKSKISEINAKFSSRNRKDNIIKNEYGDIIDTHITILDIKTDLAENYHRDVITWAEEVLIKATKK